MKSSLFICIAMLVIAVSGGGLLSCNTNGKPNTVLTEVELRVFLDHSISTQDSAQLTDYIASKPYVKRLDLISREEAKKLYLGEDGEDWSKVLDENPLPNAIHIYLNENYVHPDSIKAISEDIESQKGVDEVVYPEVFN